MREPDWQTADGSIRLFHGDCRDYLDDLRGEVDCVVTDPPYGILNVASGNTTAVRKSRRASGIGKLKDRMINTADYEWDTPLDAGVIPAVVEKFATCIVWGGNYFALPPARGVLAWDKCQPWPNFSQFELAWTNIDRPAAMFRHDKSDIDWKVHPTQKPIQLMEWCIGFTDDDVDVLDPFMGSGTTGVACVRLGRRFIGIERERKYFDIAVDRITKELNRMRLFEPPPKIISRTLPGMEELT